MDMLLALVAFIGGWFFTAKKLSHRHFLIRHLVGSCFGFLGVILFVSIGIDLGLIEVNSEKNTDGTITIFLLALAFIVYVLVKLFRRASVQHEPKEEVNSYQRPSLLNKEQRKKLKKPVARTVDLTTKTRFIPEPTAKPAITFNDWSLGEVAFTYEDSEGRITERRVTVNSVSGIHIKGECHARGAQRTFRIDRILGDLIDLETGELLSVKKWMSGKV